MQKEFDTLLSEIKQNIIIDMINPTELIDQHGIANILGERTSNMQVNHFISIFIMKYFFIGICSDSDLWIRNSEANDGKFHEFLRRVVDTPLTKNILSSRAFNIEFQKGTNPQIHNILDFFSSKNSGIKFRFEISRYEPYKEVGGLSRSVNKVYNSKKSIFDRFVDSNIHPKDLERVNRFIQSKTIINFINLVFLSREDEDLCVKTSDSKISSFEFIFELPMVEINSQTILDLFEYRELYNKRKLALNNINEDKKILMKAQDYVNSEILAINLQLQELNETLKCTILKINELEDKLYSERRRISSEEFSKIEQQVLLNQSIDLDRFEKLNKKYEHITKINNI